MVDRDSPTESEIDVTERTPTRPQGESPHEELFPKDVRRMVISLLAENGYDDVVGLVAETMPNEDPHELVFYCLSNELRETSVRLQEMQENLQVVAAMVGGLFGAEEAEDADDLLHDLNAVGQRMRRHIGLGPLQAAGVAS